MSASAARAYQPASYAPAGAARSFEPLRDPSRPDSPTSPARKPASRPRTPLRIVAAPIQSRSRAPFILTCVAILVVALLGSLFLNIQMARGAYDRTTLTSQLKQLTQQEQSLTTQLQQISAPAQLAASATSLGMVPGPQSAFIQLSTSTVIGAPSASK